MDFPSWGTWEKPQYWNNLLLETSNKNWSFAWRKIIITSTVIKINIIISPFWATSLIINILSTVLNYYWCICSLNKLLLKMCDQGYWFNPYFMAYLYTNCTIYAISSHSTGGNVKHIFSKVSLIFNVIELIRWYHLNTQQDQSRSYYSSNRVNHW